MLSQNLHIQNSNSPPPPKSISPSARCLRRGVRGGKKVGKQKGGGGAKGGQDPTLWGPRQNWCQQGSNLLSDILGKQLRVDGWPTDEEAEGAAASRWQRLSQEAFNEAGWVNFVVSYKPWSKLATRVKEVAKELRKADKSFKPGSLRSWEKDFVDVDLIRPGSHSGGLQNHAVFMGGVDAASIAGGGKRVFGGVPVAYDEGVARSPTPSTAGDSDPEEETLEGYQRDSARADDGAAPPAFLRPLLGETGAGFDEPDHVPDHYEVPPSRVLVCVGVCVWGWG